MGSIFITFLKYRSLKLEKLKVQTFMAKIRTPSNNQIKEWRKLGMSKYRKKEGLFIAEGERCVEQILANGFVDVESLVVDSGWEIPFSYPDESYEVDSEVFKSLSDTETPQGVLAVCNIPDQIASIELLNQTGFLVASDAVQDPGNVGTIIRTAAWFGAAGLLIGNGTADPYHPKVVRSTAGATGALPVIKGELSELLDEFESEGWTTFLMDGSDGSVDVKTVTPGERSIIVIGNEGNGISDDLFSSDRTSVRIPGNDEAVESLNAAIALGIGMYELRRGNY